MKNETRKLINGLIAAALMTSIFTGCSKQETESIPFSSTSLVSEVETPTGETKLYRDETLDMRYKHWYDNPEVEAAQKESYESALAGTNTGEKYMNTFNIYEDESGQTYFVSGRTPIYLEDTNESEHDIWTFRDLDTGRMRYTVVIDDDISKVSKDLVPSGDYKDYVGDTQFAEISEGVRYNVYLNNIDLKATYTTADKVMPISRWLETYFFADFCVPESTSDLPTLYLNTGAGQFEITFDTIDDPNDEEWDGSWQIEYKSEGFEQAAKKSEIIISNGVLSVSPKAIETILGFKLIVNDEFKTINIITDNKDLVDSNSMMDNAATIEPDPEPIPEPTTSGEEPTSQPTTSEPSSSQPTGPSQSTTQPQPSSSQPTPSQPTTPTQPTQPSQPSSSGNKYAGLTPTDTTGMELDANGFPANPTRGQKFVDKTGQQWQYRRGAGWIKCNDDPAHGSHGTAKPSGEIVGY